MVAWKDASKIWKCIVEWHLIKKENVTSLCSDGKDNSLLVWNKETIAILKQRKSILKRKGEAE